MLNWILDVRYWILDIGYWMYLLGLDIGSSSIKAALVKASDGAFVAAAQSPEEELAISSPEAGFAEQDPETWWHHVLLALQLLQKQTGVLNQVKAVGISYQMHGLVMVDEQQKPLRSSIIWCDSRATGYGEQALKELGPDYCFSHLLNPPGNFTASKLAWVKHHQPRIFNRISKIMLPGDYIAMKLTGEIVSTVTGYSEGMFWDFQEGKPAGKLLQFFDFDPHLLPDLVPVFGVQGTVTTAAARETGLPRGIPVTYRAGDQPNNALSLNVLDPGEVAATAGTSGVIYGILDQIQPNPQSQVNLFAHVNHQLPDIRLGVLLCINGTGIQYAWLKRMLGIDSYSEMNRLAELAPPGAEGITLFPFGNGVERIHQNHPFGGQIHDIDFNRHDRRHLIRAAQEGIVFALNQGLETMRGMGVQINTIKAGYSNLFQSQLFGEIFTSVTGTKLELYDTDGATGAARGAGIGAGRFNTPGEAFGKLLKLKEIHPNPSLQQSYLNQYRSWKERMFSIFKQTT